MIAFACTGCQQTLRVDDALAGRKARCPRCGLVLSVPAPVAVPAPPAAGAPPGESAPPGRFFASPATLASSPPNRPDETVTPPAAVPVSAPAATHVDAPLAGLLAPPQGPGEVGRLGPYRVLRVLGQGGMGVVFLAEDMQLRRPVALKAMLPALAQEPAHRQRFLREAQAAAAVEHDHIVPIYHVGEDRGVPFLAMPLLRGESLEARLKRRPRLPVAEVLRIGREAAEGLAAAHARGLVHRDIKPANVWLEGDKGRVKILDFGLARVLEDGEPLTQPGTVLGTPAYMAPEQVNAEAVDHRADLFSLGCVLYRMGTGQPAFRGSNPLATFTAVRTVQPPPPAQLNPELPPALSDLVLRLLAKEPAARPPSAAAVAAQLASLSDGVSEFAFPSAAPAPAAAPARRRPNRRLLVAVGLSVLGLAGLLLAVALFSRGRGKTGEPSARAPAEKPAERKPPPAPQKDRPAPGEVIVARDGSGQYASLRQAVVEAKAGTTLRVRPGTYKEDQITVHRNLTIVGDGAARDVVIEFHGDPPGGLYLLAEHAVVRNLTCRTRKGLALWTNSGDHRVEGCSFTCLNRDGREHSSVMATAPGHLLLRRCQVHGTLRGCGVVVQPNARLDLDDCDVYDNAYQGLWAEGSGQFFLTKCRVHDNKMNGVFVDHAQGRATLEDCEVAGNGYTGVTIEAGTVTLRNCRVNRNLVFGVSVEKNGSATVEGCDLTGNAEGAWSREDGSKVESKNNKE